jgi:methionyl-tRNA formyltransferase
MKIALAHQAGCHYAYQAKWDIFNMGGDLISIVKPIKEYTNLEYDVGLGFLYTHKIPKEHLTKPWINFHPGPLPNYRGRNLAYHAILNDEKEFGATIHYMSEEYDKGDIIEVKRFPIEYSDTAGDLVRKSNESLWFLLKKYLGQIVSGNLPPAYKQECGNYYTKYDLPEEVSLNEKQRKLIKALTVDPKFHAYVKIGNKKYKLLPEQEK